MLSKNNGFTLIEVLVAFSIVMMLVTTFIPITSLLQQERKVFSERRTISSHLHDELQLFLRDNQNTSSTTYSYMKHVSKLTFNFVSENELIKGCVTWENARGQMEEVCLYGYS